MTVDSSSVILDGSDSTPDIVAQAATLHMAIGKCPLDSSGYASTERQNQLNKAAQIDDDQAYFDQLKEVAAQYRLDVDGILAAGKSTLLDEEGVLKKSFIIKES